MVAMAVTVAGHTSLAGAEVQLLVLGGGRRWCAAIHLGTGALVSARWSEPSDPPLAPFTLARGLMAPDQGGADPIRPEDVALAVPPEPVGRTSRRRAERWLRPVLHPDREHLLGFPGPAVPYWTLSGARPSLAVVAPLGEVRVARGQCRFRWRNVEHALPVLPQALDTVPHRPRRLVVTLSPPRDGHCYKLVAALL